MRQQTNVALPIDHLDVAQKPGEVEFEAGTLEALGLPPCGWAHRHSFYEILYISACEGQHLIDLQAYTLRPHTVYVLRPEQVHVWDYSAPASGYVLGFTEAFLHSGLGVDSGLRDLRILNALADATEIPMPHSSASRLRTLFSAIGGEVAARRESHSSVLQAYLHVLLVEIARACPKRSHPPTGTASALAQRFAELVNERRRIDHSVRTYSSALGVTPGHLAESVKLVTGRTPGQIIREALVVEAKRLLVHTDQTIAQIAYELGFRDTAYFGRFFKRECGVTPGCFRQRSNAEQSISIKL